MVRARRARVHRGSVAIEVEARIDIEDVLADLSDEDIKRECGVRGIVFPSSWGHNDREKWLDFANSFRASIADGDREHCEVMLTRMLAMAGVPRLTIPTREPSAKVG